MATLYIVNCWDNCVILIKLKYKHTISNSKLSLLFYSTGWPKTMEFDNLGKKTWNLKYFEKKLEFCTKIMEKPGFFFNLNFLTTCI